MNFTSCLINHDFNNGSGYKIITKTKKKSVRRQFTGNTCVCTVENLCLSQQGVGGGEVGETELTAVTQGEVARAAHTHLNISYTRWGSSCCSHSSKHQLHKVR